MSFIRDLGVELERAGIRGPARRRIEAELADHLACDPASASRLGAPRELAEAFAAELRTVRTGRVARRSFFGLALTAALLGVQSRSMSAASGWPVMSGARQTLVSLAGLDIVLCAQIAFVAGVLALRRAPADVGQAALIQRRVAVALLAGSGVVVGELVSTIAIEPFRPLWWTAVSLVAGVVSLVALVPCWIWLRGALAVTPLPGGSTESFAADLPRAWRPRSGLVAVAIGVAAVAFVGVGSAHVEHSAIEGLTRAVLEGIAFAGGFAILGRRLGIRS